MLVLIGIVVAAAWYGWNGLTSDPDEVQPQTVPTDCPTPQAVRVRADRTVVSVYNAGAPSGAAGEAMDVLTGRGFRRGALDDAPNDMTVSGTMIWFPNAAAAEVQLVARQFRRPLIQQHPRPPGRGVNVFIGSDFPGWRKARRAMIVSAC
jgi:hypothetical protein